MATDWTAISLAALGVGGTIGGGFLGAWMQRHGQELQELQRQRDFAAEVIATARQLLTDFAPHSRAGPRTDAMKGRIDAVSTQLYVLAVRHPSKKVREPGDRGWRGTDSGRVHEPSVCGAALPGPR